MAQTAPNQTFKQRLRRASLSLALPILTLAVVPLLLVAIQILILGPGTVRPH